MNLTMEELFESEVMWNDQYQTSAGSSTRRYASPTSRNINAAASSSSSSSSSTNSATAPMKIPAAAGRRCRANEHRERDDDAGLVPPHVLVSRSGAAPGKVAFSVCSGQGRTLKGRDLRHVRDSVLRMTGYLES